ncbi:hypothetical protein [Microbulbifer sp.]|uniref:hypothetical protein n=1 Tax=Microbulbifer sp. TaxID=1908541 RepID=UPI002590D118|nr:hypothetical protein [Microbulbifer sp.]
MSGRKKNRKHHRSQPPHELLKELNSLRELLGSEEAEADIPLLDQVADTPPSDGRPPQQPTQPPRPLEEADLPILFSPVDEEPEEAFSAELSDADRALLRPLQALPRGPEPQQPLRGQTFGEETLTDTAAQPANAPQDTGESDPTQTPVALQARKEVQPELFGNKGGSKDEGEEEGEPGSQAARPDPATASSAEKRAAASENPFLPPHIRARLTGGKIPRTEPEPTETLEKAAPEGVPSSTAAEPEPGTPEESEDDTRLSKEERQALIDQLMAEQLPELERHLRLSITLMIDGLYSQK